MELSQTRVLDGQAFANGLSRFLKAVPDLITDLPKLTQYLSRSMFALIDVNAFKTSDLVWVQDTGKTEGEDEDDLVFVESYYHLMSEVLKLMYLKYKSWKKVADFCKENALSETFQ